MSGATEHENFASVEEIYQGLLARAPEHRMAPRLDAVQLAVSALGEHLSEAGLNRARVRVEEIVEPQTVAEMDRQLNLNESVLRTKVLRTDKH